MRLARGVAVAAAAVAVSIGVPATTAVAATGLEAAVSAACGWKAPLGGNWTDQNDEYWLSYNTCDSSVRGAISTAGDMTPYYWKVWVYSKQGYLASAWDGAGNGNVYTPPIPDANTQSHVCVQPFNAINGTATESKVCTGYYPK